jgi:hypothetical protein
MKIRKDSITVAVLVILFASFFTVKFSSALVTGRIYTTDADFDEGTLVGLEHTTVHDQLQVSNNITTFPTMWIANAGEDTISKWDTSTNKELARYRTWFGPAGYQGYNNHTGNQYAGAAPSRTCVNLHGDAYVANRHFDGKPADVIKILATDWIDRNGNHVMDTSNDTNNDGIIELDEMLPMNDTNNNGIIDPDEIQDERIAWVVSVGPAGGVGRSLSIAPNGDIWLGLHYAQTYYRLDSSDGSILSGPIDVKPNTPYGSLIDRQGILWGASRYLNLLRLDTNNGSVKVYDHTAYGFDYGIALGTDEHNNTIVYQSDPGGTTYMQFNSSSETFSNPASLWYPCYGIATDSKGNILASNSITGEVSKFWPNGTLIWTGAAQVASEAHGTIVDSNDNVWVIHRLANKLSKFNGTNGAPLGVFDTGDGPYTYSDATGLWLRSITARTGFWTVTFDSGADNTSWGTLSWHSFEPNGTSVTVRVRSSNDAATWSPSKAALNGIALTATPNGRYLEIETTLQIITADASPILYDLTVNSANPFSVSISPTSARIKIGENVTFTSSASGSSPPFSYQWYLNGTLVSGATSDSWTFTPTTLGNYVVQLNVTDSLANIAESNIANVTVNAGVHDVAITNVETSKHGCVPMPTVGQNHIAAVNVTVANVGTFDEDAVTVTVYATQSMPPSIVIGSTTVSLDVGQSITLTFTWNTTGFAYGYYTISATVDPVAGETNTGDNTFTDDTVLVTIPGDINGDGIIDIYDAILLANAFNSTPGKVNWNPNADINGDNIVDIYDAIMLANHYNQHYP